MARPTPRGPSALPHRTAAAQIHQVGVAGDALVRESRADGGVVHQLGGGAGVERAGPGRGCRRAGSRCVRSVQVVPSAAFPSRASVNQISTPPGAVATRESPGRALGRARQPAGSPCRALVASTAGEHLRQHTAGHGAPRVHRGSVRRRRRLRDQDLGGIGRTVLGHREHLAYLGRAPQVLQPADQSREPGERAAERGDRQALRPDPPSASQRARHPPPRKTKPPTPGTA